MRQFVYSFVEGSKDMGGLLGRKGASLAEMARTGLPVPFGFIVTTDACRSYYEDGNIISEEISKEIFEKLAELEKCDGKIFWRQRKSSDSIGEDRGGNLCTWTCRYGAQSRP